MSCIFQEFTMTDILNSIMSTREPNNARIMIHRWLVALLHRHTWESNIFPPFIFSVLTNKGALVNFYAMHCSVQPACQAFTQQKDTSYQEIFSSNHHIWTFCFPASYSIKNRNCSSIISRNTITATVPGFQILTCET